MKLKPPKVAAYWSCMPPRMPQIDPLDLVGELGDLVVGQRQAGGTPSAARPARPSWPRTSQAPSPGGALECRSRSKPRVLAGREPVDRAPWPGRAGRRRISASSRASKSSDSPKSSESIADLLVRPRPQRAVRVAVDGGGQHGATSGLRERRDIGSAAGEADAQRGLGPHDHPDSLSRPSHPTDPSMPVRWCRRLRRMPDQRPVGRTVFVLSRGARVCLLLGLLLLVLGRVQDGDADRHPEPAGADVRLWVGIAPAQRPVPEERLRPARPSASRCRPGFLAGGALIVAAGGALVFGSSRREERAATATEDGESPLYSE